MRTVIRQVTTDPPPITTNCSLEGQDPGTGEFSVQMEWTYPDIPSVIEATRFIVITTLLRENEQQFRGLKIKSPYRIVPEVIPYNYVNSNSIVGVYIIYIEWCYNIY